MSDCRLCYRETKKIADLGQTALANDYRPIAMGAAEARYPLGLEQCTHCNHIQLGHVVPPEELFHDHYAYESGTSPAFTRHLQDFARDISPTLGGGSVLEIASNDGTLLQEFSRLGHKVLGVDPAKNLSTKASCLGIPSIPSFFDFAMAETIKKTFGVPRLIVANNVMAHVADLHGFVEAITELMDVSTLFVFEVGYMPDVLLERGDLGHIYHEHLDYHSLRPLLRFMENSRLTMVDAHRIETQGGSIRCFVRRDQRSSLPGSSRLSALIAEEDSPLRSLNIRKDHLLVHARALLTRLKREGKTIAGYGAPARLCTVAALLKLTQDDVSYVVDDTPGKLGRLVPGTDISILPVSMLKADYVICFAWQYFEDIRKRHPEVKRWITLVPEVKVYD